MYQHYSFDLWLTLIKSNPYFKIERTKIFHRDFNPAGKSIDDVARAFRQVDLMCNAVNERTGKNIDADEMYLMVISIRSLILIWKSFMPIWKSCYFITCRWFTRL
jgi:putative hydrolase of the HAD superfamily